MKSAAALGCGALPGPSCFNLQPCPHQICISPATLAGFRAPIFLVAPSSRGQAERPQTNQQGRTQREVTWVGGGRSTVSKNVSVANQFRERNTNWILNDIRKQKGGGRETGWNRQSAVVLKDLGHDTQELPSYRLLQPGPPKPTGSGPKGGRF